MKAANYSVLICGRFSREAFLRAFAAVLGLALAFPIQAATVTGTLSVLQKDGRRAGDVSDAVVWVDGVSARVAPSTSRVVMRAKSFSPHVLAVPVGGLVEFPNDDPIFHNAFSVSGENRFDLDLYKRPKSGTWKAVAPGIVRVFCNIHPQMSAILVVRDNPFYSMPGADGAFSIADVPAGRYTLKAWHERGGEASIEVVVPAAGEVSVRLVLDASNYKRARHKNKFGKDYSASGADKY
jgi:plastocyanin